MKQLDSETIPVEETAALVMETVPLVMRILRTEMRSHRTANLTVPQFRALGYMRRNPRCTLSDVADHLGLTLPTSSKMVDKLSADGLVVRASVAGDRRKVALSLTKQGEATMQSAAAPTRARLAALIAGLSRQDQATVVAAMHILNGIFSPGEESP